MDEGILDWKAPIGSSLNILQTKEELEVIEGSEVRLLYATYYTHAFAHFFPLIPTSKLPMTHAAAKTDSTLQKITSGFRSPARRG
jgi:hypothetical protein